MLVTIATAGDQPGALAFQERSATVRVLLGKPAARSRKATAASADQTGMFMTFV